MNEEVRRKAAGGGPNTTGVASTRIAIMTSALASASDLADLIDWLSVKGLKTCIVAVKDIPGWLRVSTLVEYL